MRLMWENKNINGYVTKVTWSGSAKQAARSVNFSVAYSPDDKNPKVLDIKNGDEITFYPGWPDDKKTKFVGMVTNRERRSESGELTYTAMDGMIHLLRSKGTYKFKSTTPEKMAAMVCKDVQVKTGNLAKTKVKIDKMFFQNRPYYEIIMAGYTKAHRKNKKVYIAQMNGAKLEVIEKGKEIQGYRIRQGESILSSSFSESLDSMVNRVYIYDANNQKIGSVSNRKWAEKYGIFQESISVDGGNWKKEAESMLVGIDKRASLTAIGNIKCVAGLGIRIKDDRTGLTGKFWIENDSHEWSGGQHTMTLELAFKNIMDIQEEDEEQTSQQSGGSYVAGSGGTSDALNDVLNQARSWIGISGSTNEATQYYGWNGVAWCCIYIWSCFNKSGHGDLFMGGEKTAACEVVTSWYSLRGKTGKVPKVGALVMYGSGGGGHIGIVEQVHGSGIRDFTSIEGNISNRCGRFRGGGRSDVYCFCYPDWPVSQPTTSSGGGETISGRSIPVPSSVPQTGIVKDYTNYSYFYPRWTGGTMQRAIADKWGAKGKPSNSGIATIDGYYLIALRPIFGTVGDVVSVVLEGGGRINAIIADQKGSDAGHTYGHPYGGGISVVEFESVGNSSSNSGAMLNISQWAGKKVNCIINGGRYKGL